MSHPTALSMWTVTANPSDFPGKIVAREWLIGAGATTPTANAIVEDDLDVLRQRLVDEKGCGASLARHPDDDPVILETWL